MDLGALMGAVSQLEKSSPVVKMVLNALMSALSAHPQAISEISETISKIADLKGSSVSELINNGGLVRALLEKTTGGAVKPEKKVSELQSFDCEACGHTHYQLVETLEVSPIAAALQVVAPQ